MVKNMKEEYLKTDYSDLKVVKTEIMLTPLLIVLPMVVAVFLINDWFNSGFLKGNSVYNGELLLAIIILIGNIMFDVPFIRSLIHYGRK